MTESYGEFKCERGGSCRRIPPRSLPVSNSNLRQHRSFRGERFYCVGRFISGLTPV